MGKRFSKILKGQITSSAFYILLGLCLIFMPVKTVDVICKVVFGLVLIGAGCYHVYIYVREKENATILDLFSGVIVLVLGGFLFYNPQVVVKLLPLLLGAFVLVDSIWTLQGCLKLKKRGRQEWKALLLGSLIFIGLGIVMVIDPFRGVKYTVIFAGWVFLLNGAFDVAFLVLLHKIEREMEHAGESKSGQAESSTDGADSEKDAKEEGKSSREAVHEEWKDAFTLQEHIAGEDDGPLWKKVFDRRKKGKKESDSGEEKSGGMTGVDAPADAVWQPADEKEPTECTEPIDEAPFIEPAPAIEKAAPIERASDIEPVSADEPHLDKESDAEDSGDSAEDVLEEWKD